MSIIIGEGMQSMSALDSFFGYANQRLKDSQSSTKTEGYNEKSNKKHHKNY